LLGIDVLICGKKDVDGRDEPGHDEGKSLLELVLTRFLDANRHPLRSKTL
jgi:hypothetical protein